MLINIFKLLIELQFKITDQGYASNPRFFGFYNIPEKKDVLMENGDLSRKLKRDRERFTIHAAQF